MGNVGYFGVLTPVSGSEQRDMNYISSASNDKIKYAVKLGKSAAFRRQEGLFFLEGARLCSDAARTGIKIACCYLTGQAGEKYADYLSEIEKTGCEMCEISEQVAAKLSDTQSAQGVFCLCSIPNVNPQLKAGGKYLALEQLQDPSNLGAVCRTAEALGLSGLIVSGGCDIYNPKVQRAAMGSLLRLEITEVDSMPEFIENAKALGFRCFASVPDSDAQPINKLNFEGSVIMCIGNEGNGLTKETIEMCDMRVTIPMAGRAESFNAAAAAAILAWEICKA